MTGGRPVLGFGRSKVGSLPGSGTKTGGKGESGRWKLASFRLPLSHFKGVSEYFLAIILEQVCLLFPSIPGAGLWKLDRLGIFTLWLQKIEI